MIQFETCTNCGGSGLDGHDCGEDTCCCLYPDENMICQECFGAGRVESDFEDDELEAAVNYEMTKELNEESEP